MTKTQNILDYPSRAAKSARSHIVLMTGLLLAGIAVRFAVFLTCSPFNPDLHYQVIQYIAETHSIPYSNQPTPTGPLTQSFHPPLYHLVMALLYARWPGPTPIHFASFLLSSLHLVLISRLLANPLIFRDRSARAIALAIACFLPEFVMFNGFISNDALTLPLGSLLFLTMLRYILRPDGRRLAVMGTVVGIGLLTKGTFLLVGPALAVLVLAVEAKCGWPNAAKKAMLFLLLLGILGCFKYVQNYIYFGTPIVHNLDAGGLDFHQQTGFFKGWRTIFDLNVFKLIQHPVLQIHDTFSAPLMMFATFWYPHIPASSYGGNWHGYQWVGSIIYTLAIVPTLYFLIGYMRGLRMSLQSVTFAISGRVASPRLLLALGAMLLLMSNLAVVIAAGIKYDTWWCFQSRLCFQSMMAVLFLFGLGMEYVPRHRWLRVMVLTVCWAAAAACLMYFVVEIPLARGLLLPGPELKP
ncbi:MAG TPA: glycosyltransferase family 39 protein [Tepidisphaeraceae bacterium]|nr:glycosyltransferase family 39 protein [Tepidisphaeraceae bacterium]